MSTTHGFVRLPLIALIAAVALLAAACQSGGNSPTASTAAEESETAASQAAGDSGDSGGNGGDEGEETSVFDLEVGDCFSADTELLDTVLVVDCEDTHVYEVYEVFDYDAADDAFPGDAALQEAAGTECEATFEAYVGIAYEDSQWFYTAIPPNETTWADGDREILCLLHLEDESEVTGSAEGSGE